MRQSIIVNPLTSDSSDLKLAKVRQNLSKLISDKISWCNSNYNVPMMQSYENNNVLLNVPSGSTLNNS